MGWGVAYSQTSPQKNPVVRRELRSYRCIHILPPPKKKQGVKESNSWSFPSTWWKCTALDSKLYELIHGSPQKPEHTNPIGSMYAIYGNIYHQYTPNVSIYTIHGSYGYPDPLLIWNHMDGQLYLHTGIVYQPGSCNACKAPAPLSVSCQLLVDFPLAISHKLVWYLEKHGSMEVPTCRWRGWKVEGQCNIV